MRTGRDAASASDAIATVSIPRSLHARITRKAISPRLAMSTRRMARRDMVETSGGGLDDDQRLIEVHRLAIVDQDLAHRSAHASGDRVHQLHDLDDAYDGVLLDRLSDL